MYVLKFSNWYVMWNGSLTTKQRNAMKFETRERAINESKYVIGNPRVVRIVHAR